MEREDVEKIIELLTEIRDALLPLSEELDPAELDCRCLRANGAPIANCPICGGTGQS